ncbi:bifunctional RecB family nuclease/DEAD/DEAH box helicase [Nocardia camponoti]|uniref:bifunctional RecB family nuclease/DEAD/DEAH box helicase n=1 Tax=Nocardia camponoti TaxID=1616106 RepID=UPI001E337591|nr:bifunctional RecB family nuclease/DEAD/DEAH box helicase [Nocardia camponoti]
MISSVGDLLRAADCEFALLRALDTALGTLPGALADAGIAGPPAPTPELVRHFGPAMVRVPSINEAAGLSAADRLAAITAAASATTDALRAGAAAIHGAVFFDGKHVSTAELLLANGDRYTVHGSIAPLAVRGQRIEFASRPLGLVPDPVVETEAPRGHRTPFERAAGFTNELPVVDARRESLSLSLTFAAVGLALTDAGFGVDGIGYVTTATGVHPDRLDRLVPILRARRARLDHIVDEKLGELLPVQWGDPRYLACEHCPTCVAAAEAARDVLLVAGIRPAHRVRMREAGILTIDRLAATTELVPGLAQRTVTGLRRQAQLQLERERTGKPAFALRDPSALGALPAPNGGDLALVIETDDYGDITLVEVADARGSVFLGEPTAPWSDPARVLADLLDVLDDHLTVDENLHICHYGSSVRSALLDWAGRLGDGADLLDDLLAVGAFLDLAPIVRTSVLVGERDYSAATLAAMIAPNMLPLGATRAAASDLLAIRDWLLERAVEANVEVPGSPFAVSESDEAPALRASPVEAALSEFAAGARGLAGSAAALTAAILGYHRRERQPAWLAHLDRLANPVAEWADAPGVLVADWGTVDTKWHRTPQLATMRRYLTLTGRLGTGATLAPGTQLVTVYDGAAAAGMVHGLGRRATATATVLGCGVDANFDDTVRLEELLPPDCPPYDDLPAAIAPAPPETDPNYDAALELVAQELLMALPSVPENAVFDLLLRRRPRLLDGPLPEPTADPAIAIAAALGDLDASYLAVHGPPGTGKTGITGRALERLVTRHGWRIGVVAESHAVIERIFDVVVEAGLLPQLIAKKDVASVGREWSAIEGDKYPRFLDNAVNGCVIGGTTADFVNPDLFAPGSLDLLVIADAGERGLADTVAVAPTARNLLLLGDREPTYAAAGHPEPVQTSALAWLCDRAATLPPEYGYFLDRTWRMHPALCAPVSATWYEGRLRANENVTGTRSLSGESPGVSTVLVEHRGNSTESDAEAREVVRRVRALLTETWTEEGESRKLHPHDIFVVAPYAAQVARIRTLLARAKIEDVLVGTPDRFRGREAAVVLLSMTTSTPSDAPFGMRPLLSRTVIQSALCRATWKAVIIRSPLLTEYVPWARSELIPLVELLRLR